MGSKTDSKGLTDILPDDLPTEPEEAPEAVFGLSPPKLGTPPFASVIDFLRVAGLLIGPQFEFKSSPVPAFQTSLANEEHGAPNLHASSPLPEYSLTLFSKVQRDAVIYFSNLANR